MTRSTPFHYNVATKRYFFKKVPGTEVDERLSTHAQAMLVFACPDLRIEPPRIVWIRPVQPASKTEPLKFDHVEELDDIVRLRRDTTGGYTPKNRNRHEIWIRSDLEASVQLEFAVAHELRHAAQKKHRPDVFGDECRAEGDAYPYAYEMLKRYLASEGRLTDELRQEIDNQETKTARSFQTDYPHGEYQTTQCFPPGQAPL